MRGQQHVWIGMIFGMLVTVALCVPSHRTKTWETRKSGFRAAFLILLNDRVVSKLQREAKCPELTVTLHLLQRNFLDAHPYPVYLFHSLPVEDGWEGWRNEFVPEGMDVTWISLPDFDAVPSNITLPDHPIRGPPGGYNHMIRFWWKRVFLIPAVQELDYFCRIDTDSFLLTDIQDDFFLSMHRVGAKYGYRAIVQEPAYAIEDLQDFVETYLDAHQDAMRQASENNFTLAPKDHRAAAGLLIYYNNFEIVHVPTFREDPAIQDFIESVDQTWNIYLKRWGDAPLRTILCKLFIPSQRVVQFYFRYWHQGLFEAGSEVSSRGCCR